MKEVRKRRNSFPSKAVAEKIIKEQRISKAFLVVAFITFFQGIQFFMILCLHVRKESNTPFINQPEELGYFRSQTCNFFIATFLRLQHKFNKFKCKKLNLNFNINEFERVHTHYNSIFDILKCEQFNFNIIKFQCE